jgi:hypothetical protein
MPTVPKDWHPSDWPSDPKPYIGEPLQLLGLKSHCGSCRRPRGALGDLSHTWLYA